MDYKIVYRSSAQWINETGRALVMPCSDGRFGDDEEEFLRRHCRLERFDRLIVPGGPASILLASSWFFAIREHFQMLSTAHDVNKVVGIAHHDCVYYAKKYPRLTPEERIELKISDLIVFKQEVLRMAPACEVLTYYVEIEPFSSSCVYKQIE